MKYEKFKLNKYLEIEKKEKVTTLTAKAIEAYNLSYTKNEKLENPYKYKNMDKVVSYLLKAINDQKKIMVYGDYDVDGICSVSILKRMFSLLNTNIGYYIPNRYKDGYGINETKVNEIANKGYDILICIDNGINAVNPLNLAKNMGLEVLILDHHELINQVPENKYFLHPNLSDFSSYNMCASSIAFYLSIAMLAKEDEECAIYAGIATISDVMPLVEQNKLLAKNALKLLNSHKYKNLDLLIEGKEYDENSLSMTLIPKLNGLGRIINDVRVNNVIKYLFSKDENETKYLLNFINESNNKRKDISNEFYSKVSSEQFEDAIVVKDEELPEGVCGIIASRLVNNFKLPSFVFALDESKEFYKGSARSTDEIDIVNVLSKLEYLVNFGGHKKAAGLTIKREDFDKFKNDVINNIKMEEKIENVTKVIPILEEELTYKAYQELLKYGPFGEGNPYPLFIMENIDKSKVTLSKDKKHLIIKLNEDVTLIAFNLASKYQEKYNNYGGIFTIDKNNLFKNKLSCVCIDVMGG